MNGVTFSQPFKVPEYLPTHNEEVAYFTETLLCGKIHLPTPKPDAETLIDSSHSIYINGVTPIPVKLDNGSLAGCKFLFKGGVNLQYEYSAQVPEQTVHIVHSSLPFEVIITGHGKTPIPLYDCDFANYQVYSYVEYLASELQDSRTIENTVVVVLWLKRIHRHNALPLNYEDHDYHKHRPDCHESRPAASTITKQITLNEKCIIHENMPGIAELLANSIDAEIKNVKLISIPDVFAPCNLPFKKVILKGKVNITVKYLTDRDTQDVHAFPCSLKFCALLEWPGGPPVNSPLCVEVSKEFLETERLNTRNFFIFLILKLGISQA